MWVIEAKMDSRRPVEKIVFSGGDKNDEIKFEDNRLGATVLIPFPTDRRFLVTIWERAGARMLAHTTGNINSGKNLEDRLWPVVG